MFVLVVKPHMKNENNLKKTLVIEDQTEEFEKENEREIKI